MGKNYNSKSYIILVFLTYLLLALTNEYLNIHDLSSIGFTDSKSYLKIIEAAPSFYNGPIAPQQGYRFIIPYSIGTLLFLTNINDYILLIFLMIILQLWIIYYFNKIILYISPKKNFSLIMISALIFNAYNFRPGLINPYMINDWIFMFGMLLIAAYILINKKKYFYIGLILCAITRQTSLLLNFFFLFVIGYNFFFKKKIKTDIYLYGLLINILIFAFLSFISSYLHTSFSIEMYKNHMLGIFKIDYTFSEVIIWILQFINTHFFITILLILLIINIGIYKKLLNFKILSVGILGLTIWIQPILGGPIIAGGNIERLTIISLPIILIFFLQIFKDLEVNLKYTIPIILLLFISSMHHNYTFFLNYFFDYKNFHFALINFTSHLVIFIILYKNIYKSNPNNLN